MGDESAHQGGQAGAEQGAAGAGGGCITECRARWLVAAAAAAPHQLEQASPPGQRNTMSAEQDCGRRRGQAAVFRCELLPQVGPTQQQAKQASRATPTRPQRTAHCAGPLLEGLILQT